MDYIGMITQKPSMNRFGKWNSLDIYFDTSEEFNEATSKMMNVLYKENSDGVCSVSDEKGFKYSLELIHSTYDTLNNIIRVVPTSCQQLVSKLKNIQKNEK